ncbi:MAG: hypothetical protein ACYDCH_02440 [Gaiellaceae bacterium]
MTDSTSLGSAHRRQRGPLGERLTLAETKPIRVHAAHGDWHVDYGSYAQGHYRDREEAIEVATAAAAREKRELTIEDAATCER